MPLPISPVHSSFPSTSHLALADGKTVSVGTGTLQAALDVGEGYVQHVSCVLNLFTPTPTVFSTSRLAFRHVMMSSMLPKGFSATVKITAVHVGAVQTKMGEFVKVWKGNDHDPYMDHQGMFTMPGEGKPLALPAGNRVEVRLDVMLRRDSTAVGQAGMVSLEGPIDIVLLQG